MAIALLCDTAQSFDDDFAISQVTENDFYDVIPMPYLMQSCVSVTSQVLILSPLRNIIVEGILCCRFVLMHVYISDSILFTVLLMIELAIGKPYIPK